MRKTLGYFQLRFFRSGLFQSILGHVKIFVKIVNIFETFWIWKWQKVLTYWKILTRNMLKSTYFLIKKNCLKLLKFPGLNKFLDLDRGFLVWTLMSRRDWEISIEIRSRQMETPRLTPQWRLTEISRSQRISQIWSRIWVWTLNTNVAKRSRNLDQDFLTALMNFLTMLIAMIKNL
jgi:hypothetical protein